MFRPYRTEDWAAVREIYDRSKPDELRGVVDPSTILPLEADPDMNALFRDSRIIVMEDVDRVVGFVGNRGSFITWLFVHPDFRRKGVATAMVRHVLAQIEPPVTLNVAMSNAAARALYERIGFKVEREFQGNFHGNPCKVAKLIYATAA